MPLQLIQNLVALLPPAAKSVTLALLFPSACRFIFCYLSIAGDTAYEVLLEIAAFVPRDSVGQDKAVNDSS